MIYASLMDKNLLMRCLAKWTHLKAKTSKAVGKNNDKV